MSAEKKQYNNEAQINFSINIISELQPPPLPPPILDPTTSRWNETGKSSSKSANNKSTNKVHASAKLVNW